MCLASCNAFFFAGETGLTYHANLFPWSALFDSSMEVSLDEFPRIMFNDQDGMRIMTVAPSIYLCIRKTAK